MRLMTPHERFLAHLRFQPTDRPPLLEAGPWEATVRRWKAESGRSREEVLAWQSAFEAQEDTGVDFAMQPPRDVGWENWQYYWERKKEGLA